jgi:O-antigen ligase
MWHWLTRGRGHEQVMLAKVATSRDGGEGRVTRYADAAFMGGLTLMILTLPISEALKNLGYFVALGGWVLKRVSRGDLRITFTPIGIFLTIYLLASLLSAAFAFNRSEGFRGAWDVFRPLSIFLMMVNEVDAVQKIRFYLWLFVVSTGIGVVWGLVSYLMSPRARLEIRSLGHSNHTAWYLVMMLALLISLLLFMDLRPPGKVVVGSITGATLLAVLLTYSRGAVAALVASLLFLAIPLRKWQPILGVAVLTFALVGGLQVRGTPWTRHLEMMTDPDQDISLQDRLKLWKGSVLSLKDRPLLGIGPRNFKYLDHQRYGFTQMPHAHSLFFNVIAERGLLGFFSLMALFGCYAYQGMRRWPSKDSFGLSTVLWHAAMASFITILVAGVANTTLHAEGAIAFWSLTALMLVSGEAAKAS